MSRICGRCGNVCDDRAAFCEHCGMPLDTLPLNEPTARNPRIYNDNFTRQPVEPSRSPHSAAEEYSRQSDHASASKKQHRHDNRDRRYGRRSGSYLADYFTYSAYAEL